MQRLLGDHSAWRWASVKQSGEAGLVECTASAAGEDSRLQPEAVATH